MKQIFLAVVMALAGTAMITAQQQPTSQKQIKDPVEYNAYIAAYNTTDPAQKAAAMIAFNGQYPNSIMRTDAFEQAMAAYQQAGNAAKVGETARMLLQQDPGGIRALAILSYLDRAQAGTGDKQALQESCDFSQKGLQALPGWPKPDGTDDAEFVKLKSQMADIFDGGAGFCALQKKDYATAAKYYLQAVQIDPTNLQDVFQLSMAQLESSPLDRAGFWYGAKAVHLAGNNAPAVQSISGYVKGKYKNFTGAADGWDQLVAAAATQSAPPANFAASVKPKRTACELAVDAVEQNDVGSLSFGDYEFILSKSNCSPDNQAAADKVWHSIQDKQKKGETEIKLRLNSVLVIAATKDTLNVALTDDNQQSKTADLTVALETPMPHPPAPGTMINVVGALTKYTPEPFMFTMEKAEVAK